MLLTCAVHSSVVHCPCRGSFARLRPCIRAISRKTMPPKKAVGSTGVAAKRTARKKLVKPPVALSLDVLDYILSIAFRSSPLNVTSPTPFPGAISVLLVSKSFASIARRHFYSSISIARPRDYALLFGRKHGCFTAGPGYKERAAFVRELRIDLAVSMQPRAGIELAEQAESRWDLPPQGPSTKQVRSACELKLVPLSPISLPNLQRIVCISPDSKPSQYRETSDRHLLYSHHEHTWPGKSWPGLIGLKEDDHPWAPGSAGDDDGVDDPVEQPNVDIDGLWPARWSSYDEDLVEDVGWIEEEARRGEQYQRWRGLFSQVPLSVQYWVDLDDRTRLTHLPAIIPQALSPQQGPSSIHASPTCPRSPTSPRCIDPPSILPTHPLIHAVHTPWTPRPAGHRYIRRVARARTSPEDKDWDSLMWSDALLGLGAVHVHGYPAEDREEFVRRWARVFVEREGEDGRVPPICGQQDLGDDAPGGHAFEAASKRFWWVGEDGEKAPFEVDVEAVRAAWVSENA